MRQVSFLLILFIASFTASAQKTEALYDHEFKRTTNAGRYYYYVVQEKIGDLWQRKAWYVKEGTLAMEAWYKDSAAKIPHGKEEWYHTSKYLSRAGQWVDGKKEGVWLGYTEKGRLCDSFTYAKGFYSGPQFKWNSTGYMSDSAQFDGAGNGVWISWDEEGRLSAAGKYVRDTSRTGRWTFYHPNGKLMATEDYIGDNAPLCNCWDSSGNALDTALCREKAAVYPGGEKEWKIYLSHKMDLNVPISNGAKSGIYQLVVQFVVGKDGKLQEVKPLSNNGFGMEQELMRVIRTSRRWMPARLHGQPVKAYHKQPFTIMLSER